MAGGCSDDVVSGFIRLGDVEGLQKFTPSSYDWTRELGPDHLPPLVFLVNQQHKLRDISGFMKCAEWMIWHGADPQQKTQLDQDHLWSIWKVNNKDATLIEIKLGGQSALSLAFQLIFAFEERKGGADWSADIRRMQDFAAMAARYLVPS